MWGKLFKSSKSKEKKKKLSNVIKSLSLNGTANNIEKSEKVNNDSGVDDKRLKKRTNAPGISQIMLIST